MFSQPHAYHLLFLYLVFRLESPNSTSKPTFTFNILGGVHRKSDNGKFYFHILTRWTRILQQNNCNFNLNLWASYLCDYISTSETIELWPTPARANIEVLSRRTFKRKVRTATKDNRGYQKQQYNWYQQIHLKMKIFVTLYIIQFELTVTVFHKAELILLPLVSFLVIIRCLSFGLNTCI